MKIMTSIENYSYSDATVTILRKNIPEYSFQLPSIFKRA